MIGGKSPPRTAQARHSGADSRSEQPREENSALQGSLSTEREAPFCRVAVLAPGLIGGIPPPRPACPMSGHLLDRVGPPPRGGGRDSSGAWTRRSCLHPVADEAIEGADCLVLAMPTGHMAAVVGQMSSFPPDRRSSSRMSGASRRRSFVKSGPSSASAAAFIGSHPMAGSEKKGLAHADADLFQDAAVVLTPEADGAGFLPRLETFWKSLEESFHAFRPSATMNWSPESAISLISWPPPLARSVLAWEPGGELQWRRIPRHHPCRGWPGRNVGRHPDEIREAVSRRLAAYLAELQVGRGPRRP